RIRTTTAVRTARFPFISPYPPAVSKKRSNLSLSPPFFHRRARLPIRLAALDGLALVVRLLAFGQAERDLDVTVLEIHACRNQGHAALDGPADQLAYFLTMQQQLSLARRLVVGVAAMTVRVDMDVVHPDLTSVDTREAVAQVDVPLADRLDLG